MQRTNSFILFVGAALLLAANGCSVVNFQTTELYQEPPANPEPENVHGFYSVHIFDDHLSKEVWFTENAECIEVTQMNDFGANDSPGSLHIKWNKDNGVCDWIGLGIGWDDWAGKDISQIIDKAAIQFKMRAVEGELKGLPLACSLEDYSGNGAWAGMSPNTIEGGIIGKEWTNVTIPFDAFNYKQLDCDPTNIKQMMIQFEANGEVYVDDIRVIAWEGSLKKKAKMYSGTATASVDGTIAEGEYGPTPALSFEDHTMWLRADAEFLYLGAKIKDEHPLKNDKTAAEIWNGDCIEIGITGNSEADPKRKTYLLSDVQLGFRASPEPQVYSWRAKAVLNDVVTKTKTTADGYVLEAKIPLKHIGNASFEPGKTYGFEVAIDNGSGSGRIVQQPWNSAGIGGVGGFHQNPAVWGQVEVLDINIEN